MVIGKSIRPDGSEARVEVVPLLSYGPGISGL